MGAAVLPPLVVLVLVVLVLVLVLALLPLPAAIPRLVASARSSTPPCAVSPVPSTNSVRLAFDDFFLFFADIVPRNFERSYTAPFNSPCSFSSNLNLCVFILFLVIFYLV
jgi:hypothetical protein